MGGKGGGVEVPQEVEDASIQLGDIGREQFDLGLPLLQQGGEQASTVLGGGLGSLRPSVLQGLETGRSQGSQALTDVRESATLGGITGTALQDQLANTRLDVESQVAQIPSQFQFPTLDAAAQQSFSLPQQGIQNIATSLSGGASGAFAQPTSGGAVGGLAGAAGGALTGAQIGSVFPGYGTAIGAVVGGLAGGAKGAK